MKRQIKSLAITWLLCGAMPLCAQQTPAAIRILSYNVRNATGMDEQRDFQRVADVINRIAPDVAAIQELDSATQRSGGVYVLHELAQRTGMHCVYAPAIRFQGGKYGVGILSKEQPLSVQCTPLPGREEPRMLLVAEFERYVVACTHFSLTADDRLASVAIINDAIRHITKPLFLAGDMNCLPDDAPQHALAETFRTLSDTSACTFPADKPDRCIDYIYGYNNGHTCRVTSRKVVDEPVASDHRPLFIDALIDP